MPPAIPSNTVALNKTTTKKNKRKPSAPMAPEKASMLVEEMCYNALLNRHYSNPPLETSSLDCIAAWRPLPCSLCCARHKHSLTFSAPPSLATLPALIAPEIAAVQKTPRARKDKLSAKEKEAFTAVLTKFRDEIRVKEQLRGNFRNMPPTLFLSSSIRNTLLDNFFAIKSETDLPPLLQSWSFCANYTHSLYEHVSTIQATIADGRKKKSKQKSATAKAPSRPRRKRKRKPSSDDEESEYDDDYGPAVQSTSGLPPRQSTRPRKQRRTAAVEDDSDSDSIFPEVLAPPPPKSRQLRIRTALQPLVNRPKPKPTSAADIAKDFGPVYRLRVRRGTQNLEPQDV
ncbi:hypothetical protein B0H16DRAFT_337168 [Mycena metata]|uniref:Uncharacterized protein n=1 Tax=Mycena metata TaxID=1033252 RepID=A0AAD7JM30_9AGAR|nr:hypothetical protein B0H16DRAFT_337168 [Mycena metata]